MIAAYLLCAIAGVSFMGISAIMGHFAGHHGGGHGHGHGGHGGHDHAADHGHGSDHSSLLDLPYLSPTAIAAYVTGFGAAGLLLTQALGLTNPAIHVPAAAIFAALFGVGVLASMAALTERTETNTLASLQDIVGQDAEVTVAIPAAGLGEVAYVSGETRQTCTARAEAGQSFPQGSRVRVVRAVDGTLVVTRTTALPMSTGAAVVGEPVEPPAPREKVR